MSDQDDWEFSGADDAKAKIRAAIGYLLRGATGCARGDIVQAIISIVRTKLLPDCRASSRCLVADRAGAVGGVFVTNVVIFCLSAIY
jgi:hypothetical protein